MTVQVNAADLAAGGKVNLTINNGGTLSNVELTQKVDGTLQSSDGKSYSYKRGQRHHQLDRDPSGGRCAAES